MPIEGGYYIKARCIKNSPIMKAPPYIRDIWDYLIREASYSDRKYKGKPILRGQVFKSYKQIKDELCWYVGYRKVMYSNNEIKKCMRYLKGVPTKEPMIELAKEPDGVLITICNYEYYQTVENYERTSERTHEGTGERTALSREEERKKDNKDMLTEKPTRKKRSSNLPDDKLESFGKFWEVYPRRVARVDAEKAWLKLSPENGLVEKICDSVKAWKTSDAWKKDDGKYIPYPASWLNGKRWQDEIQINNQTALDLEFWDNIA